MLTLNQLQQLYCERKSCKIKFEYFETDKDVLTKDDLAEIGIHSFDDLFLYVCDYTWLCPTNKLGRFCREIEKIEHISEMAKIKLGEFTDRILYFHNMNELFSSQVKSHIKNDYLEKDYEADIVKNFDKIFPEYIFLKKQKAVGKDVRDFIDIYAKDRETERDVIIEIKLGSKNPRKQLMRYAFYFDKPILVSLTQKECSAKDSNIKYVVWNKI